MNINKQTKETKMKTVDETTLQILELLNLSEQQIETITNIIRDQKRLSWSSGYAQCLKEQVLKQTTSHPHTNT